MEAKRELLIKLRGEMTQTELARKLGIAQQTVSAIETRILNPNIKIMKKYELFFKKPMEELFPDVFDDIKLRG
jgi:putative transcriptional regulator